MWWKIVAGLLIAIAAGFFALIKSVGVTPGIIVHSLLGDGGDTPSQKIVHSRLQVPDGFSVGLYARNVVNARVIMFTRSGDLLVAQPRESKVSILARDANVDGKADGQRVLLDKPSRREVEIKARWVGFEIPDEFVVGYGIDYAQRNRNLPYIGKVRQL